MEITKEKLAETHEKFKGQYGGQNEDYFAPLFLAEKHGENIEDVLDKCSFGNYDYGIDAYYIEYIDKEAKNLYLYQFKWSEFYKDFETSYNRLINKGIERIFGNPHASSNVNEVIQRLKSEIDKYKKEIENVYIRFVFDGDVGKAEESKLLKNLKEDLELKRHILEKYFDNEKINLKIEYLSNKNSKIKQVSNIKKSHQYDISFNSPSEKQTDKGKLYLGFISLFDLYQMHSDMKLELFEINIRFGLGEKRAPNQAIKESLTKIITKKETSPEDFTFLHNGITISAREFKIENGRAKIIEPRVLNGAQTITILSHFIEGLKDRSDWEECKKTLKEIEVIGKIITDCPKDFVTQVTISNNKQNPVKAWNLRANETIQLKFADMFREKLNLQYERQEYSSEEENYLESELKNLGIDTNQTPIKVTKLAQTFLAFQGRIDKISNVDKIFEDDKLYKETFNESYLNADEKKIIIAYKIQFRLGAIFKHIRDRGSERYYFIEKARSLIWALVIQGLLNDYDDDDDFLNDYGSNLSLQGNFSKKILHISVNKIRYILSDLIEKRIDDVNNEKFGFLSKEDTFITCMEIAKKKYRWTRRKLDS
jgi:hypothetical protein